MKAILITRRVHRYWLCCSAGTAGEGAMLSSAACAGRKTLLALQEELGANFTPLLFDVTGLEGYRRGRRKGHRGSWQ